MAQLKVGKVTKTLMDEGFTPEQVDKVEKTIKANLPPETYNNAVIFLGWATLVLVVGSMILVGLNKPLPEPLWGAVGAGIGGLAGIFTGKE